MHIKDKTIVITGGASGIGRALALRFAAEGAAQICVADVQRTAHAGVADEIDGIGIPCDVASEDEVRALVERAEAAMGRIDIFRSNAEIVHLGDELAPNDLWQKNWDIHVMGHVYAARAVLPGMLERGSGYLVNTASAAGLLSHVDSATYSVTKHAAVAFAEWLSISYGHRGVRVSVLCPQAVRTAMTQGREGGIASVDGMMEPEALAKCVSRPWRERPSSSCPTPRCSPIFATRPRTTTGGSAACDD